jgi:hypothetical protein
MFQAPSQDIAKAQAHTAATISTQTLTGGVGNVTLDLTLSTALNNWGVAIFRDTAEITSPNWNKCIAVIPVGGDTTLNYVDSPLNAGTYHYRTAALTDDGVIGTIHADGSAAAT